jgi:hypothetical protein
VFKVRLGLVSGVGLALRLDGARFRAGFRVWF